MKFCQFFVCSLLLGIFFSSSYATTYTLPSNPKDTVVSQFSDGTSAVSAEVDETLLDVARNHLLGQNEIVRLNPELDRWLVKKGQTVTLPNLRILPDSPHNGITLNIAEFRMYFYPANRPGTVMSFAHGVGRQDWKTPLGETKVLKKVKDPAWHPPESIRKEHAANGDPLPEIVPPGPHNPLGAYALYLNLPGDYRIHGTDIDKIYGIGMQITHGCVRMYPEDIEQLYNLAPVGTPVFLVKQPIKVGWLNNVLYIEAHPDLEGEETTMDQRFATALALIQKANNNVLPEFDQQPLNEALKNQTGNPVAIYERLPALEEASTPQSDSGDSPAPEPASAKEAEPIPVAVPVAKPTTTTKPAAAAKPAITPKLASTATKPKSAAAGKPEPIKTTTTKTAAGKKAHTPKPEQKLAVKPAPKPAAHQASGKGYFTGDLPKKSLPKS